ncbi:MAG: PIN/TRAM domain-containing protein [Planctomycetes bacterium]|nr:PIN/TRAM domain-containing protein [Planctomycetota bacterium]
MLHVFRGMFITVCGLLSWHIGMDIYRLPGWQGLVIGVGIGVCCVALELAFARRFISVISVLMFGIVAGFVVAHFLITALNLIPGLRPDPKTELYRDFGLTFVFSFISVLAILRAKDDFKFVIPFVELKREGGGGRPLILDTSAIIDGRIVDLVDAKCFDTQILVPRFVLEELQQVADATDRLKRNRGRRGLDMLNRLRRDHAGRVLIQEATLPDTPGVDAKLVRLAKLIDGRLVTTDYNLNKVAQVQGVDVLNINDFANALRPTLVQGEPLSIKVVRVGEGPGQGVGYLEDGTMVVAEECASRIGQAVDLVVTNVLQTSAGRLVFGRPSSRGEGAALPGRADRVS